MASTRQLRPDEYSEARKLALKEIEEDKRKKLEREKLKDIP